MNTSPPSSPRLFTSSISFSTPGPSTLPRHWVEADDSGFNTVVEGRPMQYRATLDTDTQDQALPRPRLSPPAPGHTLLPSPQPSPRMRQRPIRPTVVASFPPKADPTQYWDWRQLLSYIRAEYKPGSARAPSLWEVGDFIDKHRLGSSVFVLASTVNDLFDRGDERRRLFRAVRDSLPPLAKMSPLKDRYGRIDDLWPESVVPNYPVPIWSPIPDFVVPDWNFDSPSEIELEPSPSEVVSDGSVDFELVSSPSASRSELESDGLEEPQDYERVPLLSDDEDSSRRGDEDASNREGLSEDTDQQDECPDADAEHHLTDNSDAFASQLPPLPPSPPSPSSEVPPLTTSPYSPATSRSNTGPIKVWIEVPSGVNADCTEVGGRRMVFRTVDFGSRYQTPATPYFPHFFGHYTRQEGDATSPSQSTLLYASSSNPPHALLPRLIINDPATPTVADDPSHTGEERMAGYDTVTPRSSIPPDNPMERSQDNAGQSLSQISPQEQLAVDNGQSGDTGTEQTQHPHPTDHNAETPLSIHSSPSVSEVDTPKLHAGDHPADDAGRPLGTDQNHAFLADKNYPSPSTLRRSRSFSVFPPMQPDPQHLQHDTSPFSIRRSLSHSNVHGIPMDEFDSPYHVRLRRLSETHSPAHPTAAMSSTGNDANLSPLILSLHVPNTGHSFTEEMKCSPVYNADDDVPLSSLASHPQHATPAEPVDQKIVRPSTTVDSSVQRVNSLGSGPGTSKRVTFYDSYGATERSAKGNSWRSEEGSVSGGGGVPRRHSISVDDSVLERGFQFAPRSVTQLAQATTSSLRPKIGWPFSRSSPRGLFSNIVGTLQRTGEPHLPS